MVITQGKIKNLNLEKNTGLFLRLSLKGQLRVPSWHCLDPPGLLRLLDG